MNQKSPEKKVNPDEKVKERLNLPKIPQSLLNKLTELGEDRLNRLEAGMINTQELSELVLEIGEIAAKAIETAERVEAKLDFFLKGKLKPETETEPTPTFNPFS